MSPSAARRRVRLIAAVISVFALSGCGVEDTPAPESTTVVATTPSTTTTSGERTTTTTNARDPLTVGALLVVGDWGSGTLPQGAVAGAMSRHAAENDVAAILTTGDNFYTDDTDFLMAPYGWAEEQGIPFWVAWGNHDVESDVREAAVIDAFDDPPRWAVYEWGEFDIVVLDSTQVESAEQEAFLAEAMQGENPTIVVMHHPPFSCSAHGDNVDVEERWLDDLDDDVLLVLSGHEHNYQRFETDGRQYVVTGGGGAALTELTTCQVGHPTLVEGEALHHFLVLRQAEELEASVVDVNGDVLDEWAIPLP